jgi:hypothetical protein
MAYFICRRFVQPSSISLLNHHEQKNYSTIVNSRMLFSIKKSSLKYLFSAINGPNTQVIISDRKRLDDNYNLI